MHAYRRAHDPNGGRRGLSQEGLLDLMGRADPRYLDRYDRSTVSRWESGSTLPTRERLEVFGRALRLSHMEVDGLISLAGMGRNDVAGQTDGTQTPKGPATVDRAVPTDLPEFTESGEAEETSDGNAPASGARCTMRYAWSRFVLPGSCAALAGYFMAMLSWNSSFILALYVGAAIGVLTAQGLWRLRRSDDLADLLFVTVFFLLSIPLLHAPLTRMDAYGLYSLGGLAGTSIPFTLSLIMNLLVSTVAGLMFVHLRRWQCFVPGDGRSVYGRAAWTVLPPIAFVYAFLLAFSNVGFWIVGLGLFAMVAGVFITLVVLRDRDISIAGWDRKFLLCTAVAVTIVLSALGLGAILVAYMQPSSYAVTDQGLFYTWEMDFEALGYSPEEYVERSRLAVTWASLMTLAYMVIAIGGRLIVTIYRMDGGDTSMVAPAAVAAHSSPRRRPKRLPRVDLRHWVGCVFNLRVFRRGAGSPSSPSG